MFDTLTVREILSSTARLKLPASVDRKELLRRVDDVIESLDIGKCQNTQVGKCSGGEKRRLAVAAELLGEPSLLFLDEPTSGLDGTSALNVMAILRRLAKEQHRTIICTIHQPRASLLPLADQLILLADGRQVYGGPTWSPGRRDGMLGYFAGLGFPSPSFENPADFMVDLVNDTGDDDDDDDEAAADGAAKAGTGTSAAAAPDEEAGVARVPDGASGVGGAAAAAAAAGRESATGIDVRGWDDGSEGCALAKLPARTRVVNAATLRASKSRAEFVEWLAEQYAASDVRRRATEAVAGDAMPLSPLAARDGERVSRYPTSFWTQTSVVFKRVALFKLREPEAVATLFSGVVVVALIVGLVYLQLPVTTQGLADRFGFLSLFAISVGFAPIDLVLLFPKERAVFLRDSAQNLYGTLAFYCGRTLADLPFQLGFSAIAAVIAYFMVGFQLDAGKLLVFVLSVMAVMWCTAGLFMAVSSVSPDVASANGIATLVLIFAMLFSGTFIGKRARPRPRSAYPRQPAASRGPAYPRPPAASRGPARAAACRASLARGPGCAALTPCRPNRPCRPCLPCPPQPPRTRPWCSAGSPTSATSASASRRP